MFRDYNKKETLTKEDLINDPDFYRDATKFLSERGGIKDALSPQDAYDAFMEHMRFHNVNEVTTLRDLEYAQNADLEGKLRFGNLLDAYDKVDGEVSLTSALDYAEGIATAPSTYLGILTGGTGKTAAMAGTQVAKLGVRKILGEALRGSARAAAVEGAIGFGQGLTQQQVRVETGLQEEADVKQAIKQGGIAAGTAGLINFPIGAIQAKQASRANELLASAELQKATKVNSAAQKTNEVLNNATKTTTKKKEVAKIKETLQQLDPDKVKKGRQIKQASSSSDALEAGLPSEVIDNIAAAALRIKDELNIKPNERITSALQRALSDGKMKELDSVQNILDEHNLSYDEFSLFYLAEISEAGKILGTQGRLKQAISPKLRTKAQNEVDDLLFSVDRLNKGGKSSIDSDTAKRLADNRTAVGGFFKDLDKMRLGVMTSQPATTMRNNLNAGFRVAVDAATRTFDNVLNLRNPFDGTFDMAKYTLNPYEAQVIQKLFKDSFPVEGGRLFREAADLEARAGGEGALATIGRKINVLNTASDNIWKRAILSASLNRRISDAGIQMTDEGRKALLRTRMLRQMDEATVNNVLNSADDAALNKLFQEYGNIQNKKTMGLYDIIETGQLGKLPDDIIKESIEDAYSFVYQTSMKGENLFGRMGKAVIKGHQDYPMLISSVMPFPRYIANQMKFVYEHAPIIGMLHLDRLGAKAPKKAGYYKDMMSKQLTGGLMLTAAYNWRVKQGDTEYWYEFKDNTGNVIDGRAVYGPFAPFMLAADLIYRYQRGTMPTSINSYARDTLQALFGSTFRAGLGLYTLDKLYTDIESGAGLKTVGEGVANIINSFTIPASAVRDVYAQFDRDVRGIPETRNGDYNFFDVLYNRGMRSMPKNFAANVDDESGFLPGAERAVSPFQTGELQQVNPLEKQIFGFSKRPAKNSFQQEMGKLNIQAFDLYKRDPNEKRDLYMRQELSKEDGYLNMNDRMMQVMNSPLYKSLGDSADDNAIKRDIIDTEAKKVIQEARDIADARIERDASDVGAKYTESELVNWNSMNSLLKARIDAEYRKVFGGESVSADRDKTIEMDGKTVNVLRWATDRAKQIRGKAGGV